MADITKAHEWAVSVCKSDNVGYSQDYRNQQTVNGVTYYDCSSFIWYALLVGGFNVSTANGSSYPFTTSSMGNVLTKLGFTQMSTSTQWKAGDILLRTGHTEMVYVGYRTMGAHNSSLPLADQVSINDYGSSPSDWEVLYRYVEPTSPSDWIKGNRYLSKDEMKNNAKLIYRYFIAKGWTINAIAGVLGNMESESTINPGIWQGLTVGSGGGGGYGLVQWTPWTNYTNWADSNGYEWDDGNAQCKWIDEVTASFGQWIPTDTYPMTWNEFKTSTRTPQYLASAFLKNFERAGVEVEEERRTQADYWLQYLMGIDPNPPITPTTKRRKMPLYMMLKHY